MGEIQESDPGLLEACGCYVFAVRASKGYTPWYVGQANKTRLVREALNFSNCVKYNNVLAEYSGTPMLFFLPQVTKSGKSYAKPTAKIAGRVAIDFWEKWLIATSLQKNSDLINEKNTAFLRNLHVTGIFNPSKGESNSNSKELGRALY